ncbi:MAG: hypothetical protein ABIR83_00590 [Nakamurella sp.]
MPVAPIGFLLVGIGLANVSPIALTAVAGFTASVAAVSRRR